MIQFFVACVPRGKQRARVLRSGRSYTPKETVDLERLIAWECKKAMGQRKPLEGPLWLTVKASFHYPKAWSVRKRALTNWKDSKPDIDNIVKLVKDSLKGIAWGDDAQVAVLRECSKEYILWTSGLSVEFGPCP